WGVQTVEETRKEFVERVMGHEKSKTALCREYGISRKTGDKWIARYQAGEPMSDRSRAPRRTPRKTSKSTEEAILRVRQEHPALGAKKIKRWLEDRGESAPAYSTINTILHRCSLITPEASAAATPYIRFEKSRPNEMWQADFKGHFAMLNRQRCHPLTVLDDHSRYCLCIDAKENEKYEGTKESFRQVFRQYGLPDTFLCDNGNPWGTAQSVGYTRFEVDLMNLGILPIHCRPRHPQTQGKEERFNGTLNRERLRYRSYEDMAHAQRDFDEYRRFYNTERPHHALGLATPATRFHASQRRLPSRIEEWTYGTGIQTRTVKSSGYLTLGGQGYFLSEAFGGLTVGLMEDPEQSGVFIVVYRQFGIARINVDDRVIIARKAFRFTLVQ
ncbi:MAG: IS481 family transposase, partial [Oscillospiraceae bacterium]|nr:IS481 family transposase [Oscillospiraceae bacterium]